MILKLSWQKVAQKIVTTFNKKPCRNSTVNAVIINLRSDSKLGTHSEDLDNEVELVTING